MTRLFHNWTAMGLLGLLAGFLLTAAPRFARAAEHPRGPVRLLVGFAPGGAIDTSARALAEGLTKKWGVSVFVDNKPGASGIIAIEELRRARPDGQTLLVTATGTLVMLPHITKVTFDPRKDFTPLAMLIQYPFVMVAARSMPFNTVKDLVAYAKQNPGKLSYSTAGIGSTQHFATELLKQSTSIDMVHVPYKGDGATLADLVSGRVTVGFLPIQTAKPLIDAGKLKAIVVTGARRVAELPNTQTALEAGFTDLEVKPWVGLIGPAGMPPELVNTINATVNEILQDPATKSRLTMFGSEIFLISPTDMQQFITHEFDRWGQVALKSHISAE